MGLKQQQKQQQQQQKQYIMGIRAGLSEKNLKWSSIHLKKGSWEENRDQWKKVTDGK